jgi:SPP1 family predicted phage head-tail adaptor
MSSINTPLRPLSINAGSLRDRVALQAPPAVDDGSGGRVGGWTTIATLSAQVIPMGGAEAVQATIETSVVQYRVHVRRRTFDSGQRLLWQGQALDIRAVLPDGRRAFMTLLCEGKAA